jgi:drug/metabolite transporter (DMT)-like permease
MWHPVLWKDSYVGHPPELFNVWATRLRDTIRKLSLLRLNKMSPWVPIIFSLLSGLLVIATQTYNKVTTPEETKDHLRKLRGWAPTIVTVVLLAVQGVTLIRLVESRDPLTRRDVFSIALSVGSIYFLMSSWFNMQTLRLIGRLIDVQGRLIDVTNSERR